ncbi:MAG: FGGY-family carbohydrate kinase [Salinarimonas sp.]
MPADPLYLGLDIGTSGARAILIDDAGVEVAAARSAMAEHGPDPRQPAVWRAAAFAALEGALRMVDRGAVRALCVDGTSGTMLAVDAAGRPLGAGSMYNDPCTDPAILDAIASHAPVTSAAHGPTSGAARAVLLSRTSPARLLHQADWIAFLLSGRMVSDANNALKTGYDPIAGAWPDWLEAAGVRRDLLPPVLDPGVPVGPVTARAAEELGLSPGCLVVAGTTDGCASFLATGASEPGDAVSALGTTLTVKLLSDRPIFAPQYGIYSHRLLGQWLAGGASNTGGAALLAHFDADEIARLSPMIDPERDTGLDFYPLPRRGERFPIADPALEPRVAPRPERDADFLHALLEGVAEGGARASRGPAGLGAPAVKGGRSVGGGAGNPVWTRSRARRLGAALVEPVSGEAGYGAARLARRGGAP